MIALCYVCRKSEDCRPYGAGGTMICFPCMTADPVREREAERQFAAQFRAAAEAISPVVILDGVGGTGPMPFGGDRQ